MDPPESFILTFGLPSTESQRGRRPSSTILPSSSTLTRRSSDNAPRFQPRLDTSENLFLSDDNEPARLADPPYDAREHSEELSVEIKHSGPFPYPAAGGEQNEMLRKLFFTYQQARRDFHATPLKSLERTKSAKFLRDTTENCIAYIASREDTPGGEGIINTDIELTQGQSTLDEMRSTLEEAKKAAEAGSGGKKRRFDESWANIPEGPAKMRPSSIVTSLGDRDPIPRGQIAEKKLGNYSLLRRIERQPAYKPGPAGGYHPRRASQAERMPHGLYPASAGQGKRRVFPMPVAHHAKRTSNPSTGFDTYNPTPPTGYGDCYRPSYR